MQLHCCRQGFFTDKMAESNAGLGDNLDNLSVKYVNLNKSDFEDNSKTAIEIRSVKHLTTDLGAVYAVPEKAKFRGSGDSSALSSIKNIKPDIIQGNNGDGHSIIVRISHWVVQTRNSQLTYNLWLM